MSCTAYIVYTFHRSLHHANLGQFKAKRILLLFFAICVLFDTSLIVLFANPLLF